MTPGRFLRSLSCEQTAARLGRRTVPLTKKQIILEYCRTKALERIGGKEIRSLENEVRVRLGKKISLSYIAGVLRAAGKQVDFDDRFTSPPIEEPYASRLRDLLEFHDLSSAEASLRKLDALFREYLEVQDRTGARWVRTLLLNGKLRASSLAVNPRVNPRKRAEKAEIATWFRIWLQTPDLFFDWLDLRKASEEFRRLFSP